MRMVNTTAHAVCDYAFGLVLAFAPFIFRFGTDGSAYKVCLAAAAVVWWTAILTRFELSAIRIIPLRIHLWIDIITGCLLAVSPFALNFKNEVYKPHLVFGLTLAVIAALTDNVLHEQIKKTENARKTLSE